MTTQDTDFNIWSSDKPITNPDNDRLGYAPFAKHLAVSICKMTPLDGLVIAIYGPWGSGKSSLLEFVIHYLESQETENEQPIIIRFNPWWFSGHDDLTRHFFGQLQAVLPSKIKEFGEELRTKLAKFGSFVSKMPSLIVPEHVKDLGKFVENLASRQAQDISQLKNEIDDLLRKQKQKTLIVIDDIDRLTAEEIRHLFRFIKAVADFPNVIYLLAFDKEVVAKALERDQQLSGEAYLEKIVQVPFNLPSPDRFALSSLLAERMNQVLEGTPENLWDNTHWGNVFHDGIRYFIKTPRDINRLANTLNVTYSSVRGEVNAVNLPRFSGGKTKRQVH